MCKEVPEFGYEYAKEPHTVPVLQGPVYALMPPIKPGIRVLDLGCGNGVWAGNLLKQGAVVVGVDASTDGIAAARKLHPTARFEELLIDDQMLAKLNEPPFDVVISTEVVEHLYDPRTWAKVAFGALKPGGRLICSTPYHGYLKNVAIAALGKFDWHVKPLWDGGHIKFWSRDTLSQLLTEAGFVNLQFRGAGRFAYMWMSMVMSGDRPV